jgi:glycosyltransferase involved in cell wall biosynthesis
MATQNPTAACNPIVSYAVIMPAYNASATIAQALGAIAKSTRTAQEVIVFDDGSTDNTPNIARTLGASVISGKIPKQGPGHGRSECAKAATSDILVFIDADVAVWSDSIRLLIETITENATVAAAFGSYDAEPACRNWAAKYANLRHHHFHQIGNPQASTFWTGFGAVKREVFLDTQGFNSKYSEPSIEDVEFGTRLRKAGHEIRLVPEAVAKHYKDWTLRQLWRTDIFNRAVPWSRLLISKQIEPRILNTSHKERLSAILALSILLSGMLTLSNPFFGFFAALATVIYAGLNHQILSVFFKANGILGLISGLALHVLYHSYASLTFIAVIAAHKTKSALRAFEAMK